MLATVVSSVLCFIFFFFSQAPVKSMNDVTDAAMKIDDDIFGASAVMKEGMKEELKAKRKNLEEGKEEEGRKRKERKDIEKFKCIGQWWNVG